MISIGLVWLVHMGLVLRGHDYVDVTASALVLNVVYLVLTSLGAMQDSWVSAVIWVAVYLFFLKRYERTAFTIKK